MLDANIFNSSFVNLVFMGIIALFPVINPLGSAFLISPYLKNLTPIQKRNAVRKITFYAFGFCVCILFVGPFILQAFGITISIIQLGG
ncbi:MarC family protein, partial [Flavobacterium sp. IB48]|nr:MarC family protein [Flavobacterium sp. IB48]